MRIKIHQDIEKELLRDAARNSQLNDVYMPPSVIANQILRDYYAYKGRDVGRHAHDDTRARDNENINGVVRETE